MLIGYSSAQANGKAFAGELLVVGRERPRPLYNAENLVITQNGRLFATGSTGIFEITVGGTERPDEDLGPAVQARWLSIPVDPPSVQRPFMTNGVATDEEWLYVACAAINQTANPLTMWWRPFPQIEQTPLGSLLLHARIKLCPLRSWVVRARLKDGPLVFDQVLPLEDDCFANGIQIDTTRRCLFVACGTKKIAQVRLDGDRMTQGQSLVLRGVHGRPNGAKIHKNELFITTNEWMSMPATSYMYRVGPLDLPPAGASAPPCEVEAELVCRRLAFFDDFDQVDQGFVVSAPADFMTPLDYMPPWSGCLCFIDGRGVCVGRYRHPLLRHPSAVRVVRGEAVPGARPGDILVTEKHGHTLYLFRPEPALREWLIA